MAFRENRDRAAGRKSGVMMILDRMMSSLQTQPGSEFNREEKGHSKVIPSPRQHAESKRTRRGGSCKGEKEGEENRKNVTDTEKNSFSR